jgi:hypothetical protein
MAGCATPVSKTFTAPPYVAPPPAPVDASTINIDWGTPTDAETAPGSLSWGLSSGATNYNVGVNGVTKNVSGPPVPITVTPGSTVDVSIAPCN